MYYTFFDAPLCTYPGLAGMAVGLGSLTDVLGEALRSIPVAHLSRNEASSS